MPTFNFSDTREATNAELASEIESVTKMSSADVERMFPTKADKEILQDLLSIVNSSASNNSKLANIRSNFTKFGGTLLKLTKNLAF